MTRIIFEETAECIHTFPWKTISRVSGPDLSPARWACRVRAYGGGYFCREGNVRVAIPSSSLNFVVFEWYSIGSLEAEIRLMTGGESSWNFRSSVQESTSRSPRRELGPSTQRSVSAYGLRLFDLLSLVDDIWCYQVRWAVWGAGKVYGEILDAIEANDYDNLSQRAYVPR